MADYPYVKAGGINQEAGIEPFFLHGGESPMPSNRAQVAAGQVLAIFTVVAFNGAGELIAWDGATGKPAGITAEPVDATAGVKWVPYYSGGQFNHEALVWPAGVATLAARRAAFAGTDIGVHRLP